MADVEWMTSGCSEVLSPCSRLSYYPEEWRGKWPNLASQDPEGKKKYLCHGGMY